MACEDKEKEWMDKLQEATDKWDEMMEADKDVMEAYEDAKNILLGVWGEIGVLARHGEGLLGMELGLIGIYTEGLSAEERLKDLAEDQRERDDEYKDLLEQSDALLEELCECLRGD